MYRSKNNMTQAEGMPSSTRILEATAPCTEAEWQTTADILPGRALWILSLQNYDE